MDNCRGDLADILGASSGDGNTSGEAWQFQTVSDGNYKKHNYDYFGDPFSCVKDPLLDELDMPKSTFFDNLTDNNMRPSVVFSPKVRPSNIYSRIHQISPNTKLPISNDMIESSHIDVISSPNSSKTCLVGNSLGLHMSSSRNMSCPGIKRRKSQAKKVVCIPATTPVNNRPAGGEVVPSDQWAWRKYGQKPIKGSPYPRGYYRCSSSKGCSARKQVERSRNDPKMLLITYTSDHNHPLPTQRNALAGSTRSQPLKNAISSSKVTAQAQQEHSPLANIKEESKTNDTKVFVSSPTVVLNAPTMKEERKDFDNVSTTMDFSDDNSSYRPLLPPDMMGNGFHSEDFFAELGEIGDDDQSKMFFSTTPGFPSDHDGRESDKALDAFPSFFEWIGISNTDNDPSFGDTNSGL